MFRSTRTILCLLLALTAAPAFGELPDAATMLRELGLGADEIAQVQAGQFVSIALKPASERELVAGIAFQVSAEPSALVGVAKKDLLDQADPSVISHAAIAGAGPAADFQNLALQPDSGARAHAYVTATPGGSLNLSSAEIAAFGSSARARRSPSSSNKCGARCSRGCRRIGRRASRESLPTRALVASARLAKSFAPRPPHPSRCRSSRRAPTRR